MACIAFDLVSKRIGTLDVDGAETAAHTDLLTDTLYLAVGTAVLPQFEGAMLTGVHRGPVLVLDAHPTFAWLRVEGPVDGLQVRIFGDGALHSTSAGISSNDPRRLPAGRHREIEIEVSGTSRATDVVLATTTAELVRA